MRISDWSSDVCSSDLGLHRRIHQHGFWRRPSPEPHRQALQSSALIRKGPTNMSTAPLANPANDIRPDGFFSRNMAQSDPAIAAAISKELEREKYQVELIASENIVSKAVLEAQGSVLTNKYAEGYPGKRYYQGCAPSDEIEQR